LGSASALQGQIGQVFTPTPLLEKTAQTSSEELLWYDAWVRRQIKAQPQELFSVVSIPEHSAEHLCLAIWREVAAAASSPKASVDTILSSLLHQRLLKADTDEGTVIRSRNLVFTIVGWQTMLYKSAVDTCPPAQLAIVDETDQYRGRGHIKLRESQRSCGKPLHELLLGFGVMLPPREPIGMETHEVREALRKYTRVSPKSFNAHLLAKISGISIRWTDSLACHLEFDPSKCYLYLFRFPSFCVANLVGSGHQPIETTIHACAAPKLSASPWASPEEVDDLLQEVLRSYRLLFGQDKRSRKYFRNISPFEDLDEYCVDGVLMDICGRKQSIIPIDHSQELDEYILSSTFPVLRGKIVTLIQHLSSTRPRTWKEIWHDKRDSASWFTFWAVLIIGGIGILLAFLQVVLQIVQIMLQVKNG